MDTEDEEETDDYDIYKPIEIIKKRVVGVEARYNSQVNDVNERRR
jgi:hypothetical protein